jgi:pimeloyl-ACP methyl ester carboxylesterase/DNA-binding CsgD family transcriptional regulator
MTSGPASSRHARPATQYAQHGGVHLAYQVVGAGACDLVHAQGWVSHVEYAWADPRYAAFLERLARFSRLIVFDKRGTGLSDRNTAAPILDERVADLLAVLDAAGSERTVLFSTSEAAAMCALFAATYPERTAALVIYSGWVKRLWAPDYPWAPTWQKRREFIDFVAREWGGPVDLADLAPSVAGDPKFSDWFASYLRHSASPGAALALAHMNTHIDIRDVLSLIHVPTLVLHRTHDRDSNVAEGRYLAEHIPGARFVELDGIDHLPWVGDSEGLVANIEEFVKGLAPRPLPATMLRTVVAVDTKTTATSAFVSAAEALLYACDLCARAKSSGNRLRIGLHTGETSLGGPRLTDEASRTAVQLCRAAGDGEIVASRAVKNLVAGSRIAFTDYASPAGEYYRVEWRDVEPESDRFPPADAGRKGAGGSGRPLTERQREVLQLVAQGLSNREIASRLELSEHTVHRHIANCFNVLGVYTRAAAVAAAYRDSLI